MSAEIAAILVPAALVILATLVAYCRLYHISGHKWWTAIVPVYNSYVLGKEAFNGKLGGALMVAGWALSTLFYCFPVIMIVPDEVWTAMNMFSVLYMLAGVVCVILMLWRLGFSLPMSILSGLLPVPFLLITGFGNVGRRQDLA